MIFNSKIDWISLRYSYILWLLHLWWAVLRPWKSIYHHILNIHQSKYFLIFINESGRKLRSQYLVLSARAGYLALLFVWRLDLSLYYTFRWNNQLVILVFWLQFICLYPLSYGDIFIEIVWFEAISIWFLDFPFLWSRYFHGTYLWRAFTSWLCLGHVYLVLIGYTNCFHFGS